MTQTTTVTPEIPLAPDLSTPEAPELATPARLELPAWLRSRGSAGREVPSSPAPERPRRVLPAAVRWEDVWLPGLGRVRASGWVPTVLIAACAVALVYLLQTSGVATTGYDIQRLEAEQKVWELRNEQLRLELAKVRSLAWVEAEAISRLGMVRPEQVTFLRVEVAGNGPR